MFRILPEMLHLLQEKPVFLYSTWLNSKTSFVSFITFGQPLRPLDHFCPLFLSVSTLSSSFTGQPLRPKTAKLCVL